MRKQLSIKRVREADPVLYKKGGIAWMKEDLRL